MKQILILSDIHSGTTRPSQARQGIVRQPSSNALEQLTRYREKWKSWPFDMLVDLGDLTKPIHESNENEDLYKKAVESIKQLDIPTTFIYGNHDAEYVSVAKMKMITGQAYFNSVRVVEGIQLVMLECTQIDQNTSIISPETMDWFGSTVDRKLSTIILSHYSLVPIKMTGSFGFEGKDSTVHVQNYLEFAKFIEGYNVRASINGHLHWGGYSKLGRFPCITVPPFTDNFLISSKVDAHPGIYNVLTIDDKSARVQSYSGDYCFMSIEL